MNSDEGHHPPRRVHATSTRSSRRQPPLCRASMETETKQQHLPQDLITAILLRLPVKSLLRFKSVCKFWGSLVSDPDFARSRFGLATPRLVFNTRVGIRTMEYLDGSLHTNPISEPINFGFLPTYSHTLIVGSCRGFLLLECNGNHYLWNPSTRVHKPIPTSPLHTNRYRYLYGFGYDSSKDDYLVVEVPIIRGPRPPNYLALVQFFSVRANMWKQIEGINPPSLYLSSSYRRTGLLFNGAIHWLSYDRDRSMDLIVAFDLMEKRLSEIPHPNALSRNLSSCDFWVHRDFFSLSVRGSDALEIWVMEEYKVQSSWTKSLVLSMSGFKSHFTICSTKSGDIVMDDETEKAKLVKYSDKGELLEHCECPGKIAFQVPLYIESIFSLPGVNG